MQIPSAEDTGCLYGERRVLRSILEDMDYKHWERARGVRSRSYRSTTPDPRIGSKRIATLTTLLDSQQEDVSDRLSESGLEIQGIDSKLEMFPARYNNILVMHASFMEVPFVYEENGVLVPENYEEEIRVEPRLPVLAGSEERVA